jgi:type III pantothenate kinase
VARRHNDGMTLLALDVGNTRLKWALYQAPRLGVQLLAHGAQFLDHIERLPELDWADLPTPGKVLGCIVAGDPVKWRVEQALELWDVPVQWVVASEAECGVRNGYDHPTRLGADRWVALIGARTRMQQSGKAGPCVVVMVGTAVTVEAMAPDGTFLGGMILPGHGIMLRALESGTAGLHVPTGEVVAFPTNTSDALTSGGTYAIAGAVARMMEHVAQRFDQPAVCLMTGGAGWKMLPSINHPVELVEGLIFEGLLALAQSRFGPAP